MSEYHYSVRRLTLFDMEFIALVGAALHFIYELSGGNILVVMFSAIIESV